MNPTRCDEYDYINFLVAAQKVFSCTEAARVQPYKKLAPAHDALNRLLLRYKPNSSTLWEEAYLHVQLLKGLLVLDDSTLDKLYARKIELVSRHWSGKHHRIVQGINLVTLLWTDGDSHIPCDYRIYYKDQDGKTKNDHFRELILKAKIRGFNPECLLFDSWYSSLKNLKKIRSLNWNWLTRFKANRLVNPDQSGNIPLSQVTFSERGTKVHLKGYGFILVFRIVSPDGSTQYWGTSDLKMNFLKRLQLSEFSWKIENYHRGLKQFCGVEKAQFRSGRAQRNHIGFAIRAFLRLEVFSLKTGFSWFEAKNQIIREAIRGYLNNPIYNLSSTA
jgi:putative transposase